MPSDGIYVFSLTDDKGTVYPECTLKSQLKENDVIIFDNGLKKGNVHIDFTDDECNLVNQNSGDKYVVTVNKIIYIGK